MRACEMPQVEPLSTRQGHLRSVFQQSRRTSVLRFRLEAFREIAVVVLADFREKQKYAKFVLRT